MLQALQVKFNILVVTKTEIICLLYPQIKPIIYPLTFRKQMHCICLQITLVNYTTRRPRLEEYKSMFI